MLQGVIFDLDGVIVDSHPAHLRAWRAFFELLGKEVSDEQLLFVLDGRKREDILRHFLGNLSTEQLRHYGERKEALFRDFFSMVSPIAGINELLESLRASGIPAAVASSASRRRVQFMLDRLSLTSQFKVVIAGEDVAVGKPDPAVFYKAVRGLGVVPASVVVCEDSVSGVQAAKSAEMKCLGIAVDGRRPMLLHAGADSVVPDFGSVSVAYLQKLAEAGSG